MKKIISVLLISLIAISIVAGCTEIGIKKYKEYKYYKDNSVPVTATISKIEERTDSDDDTYYIGYVSYSYKEETFNDVYWKRVGSNSLGDKVSILIGRDNPRYIFHGETGLYIFIIACCLLVIMLNLLTKIVHKKIPDDTECYYITDGMVANDLKPKFTIFLSKSMLCIGTMFIIGNCLLSELFSITTKNVGITFFIFGVLFLFCSIFYINRISKTKYQLYIDKCVRKWSKNSGEDTDYYTTFSKLGTVNGDYGKEGNCYYMVVDHNGRLKNIYDVEFWKPSIDDNTLYNGGKIVLKNFIVDLFIMTISAFVYVGLIYMVIEHI